MSKYHHHFLLCSKFCVFPNLLVFFWVICNMVHLFPFSVLVVVTEEALHTLSHGRVPAFYVPEVRTSHLLFMGLSLWAARGGGYTFQRPSLASSCIGITGKKTTSAPGLHRESFVVNQMSAQVSLFVFFS